MIKKIHIRTSNESLDTCWIRSSKYHNNIFKVFSNSNNGVNKLIQFLLIGYEQLESSVQVTVESYNNSHKILEEKLLDSNIKISIISQTNEKQLDNYINVLEKKIKFMHKVLADYEYKIQKQNNSINLNLSKTSLKNSINTIESQINYTQDKYNNYIAWKSFG